MKNEENTHTYTHAGKRIDSKMIQMLESADENFKVSVINLSKILKRIWPEWENKQEIIAEEQKVILF